jgi:hypothetical protein
MPSKRPTGKAALQKRQKQRADLKEQDIIWIGIAATEQNIQRLGALLLFAEMPVEVEAAPHVLLPWEDPNDPRYQQPPELEVNYELVRRDITKAMTEILQADADLKPRILETIKQHGGERLSLVPETQLPELYAAINRIREEIT